MGVDLTFDAAEWERTRVARERSLLAEAKDGNDVAAAELLFWYAKFGSLSAKDVQAVIEEGSRDVMRAVLEATSLPNARHGAEIQPLMYFGNRTRKRGPKSTRGLLELRHAFGVTLSMDELRTALTTEWAAKSKSRNKARLDEADWPQPLGEVENQLIEYVLSLFKDATEAEARRYVHESFPWISWDTPTEPVDYPPDW